MACADAPLKSKPDHNKSCHGPISGPRKCDKSKNIVLGLIPVTENLMSILS